MSSKNGLRYFALLLAVLAAFGGCSSGSKAPLSPPPAIVTDYTTPSQDAAANPPALDPGIKSGADVQLPPPWSGTLTLRIALQRALMYHPSLQAASFEVRAREAETLQAGLLPNPEIETEIENFGGDGGVSGFDRAETTVTLGQLIEIGGKRSRRTDVARNSVRVAQWDFEVRRLQVYTEIGQRFYAALAAEREMAVTEDLLATAEKLEQTVRARVRAGKVSPIENERAAIVVGRAHAAWVRAAASEQAAFQALAKPLGLTAEMIERLEGGLSQIVPPPSKSDIASYLDATPRLARWSAEIEHRRAELGLAEANRFSDLRIGGGVRFFEETGNNAFVATFSMPLPLYDRNQGNVSAARRRLAKGAYEREAEEIGLTTVLTETYADLVAAAEQALTFERDLLPAASRTFEATRRGYEEGKFDLVTLLDAQRTFFEVQIETIQAAAAYHSARAQVEGLIGRNLSTLISPNANGDEIQ